jgi:hypothetical protein
MPSAFFWPTSTSSRLPRAIVGNGLADHRSGLVWLWEEQLGLLFEASQTEEVRGADF